MIRITQIVHPARQLSLQAMRFGWIVLGMLALVILLGLTSGTARGNSSADLPAPEASVWDSSRIDAPQFFRWMKDRSMRLDSSGRPHIAFGGDHLYYAYHDGSNWVIQMIDSSDGVGHFASLFLDSGNHPHISYYDNLNGALKYARNLGSGWEFRTVDQASLNS